MMSRLFFHNQKRLCREEKRLLRLFVFCRFLTVYLLEVEKSQHTHLEQKMEYKKKQGFVSLCAFSILTKQKLKHLYLCPIYVQADQ